MPGTAQQFLDLLQERKLLPGNMIDGIRRQVEASPDQFNAHHIAKLLQRKGKLTAFQARELLAEVEDRRADIEPAVAESITPVVDDELGLAEADDDKTVRKKAKNADVIKGTSPAPTKKTPTKPDPPASLSGGIDDLLDDPLLQSAQAADPLLLAPKKKKGFGLFGGGKQRGKRTAAGWDSPLIIVGGGILLLLLLIGGVLAFVLTRESGDALYAAAEQNYLNGSYAKASTEYESFAASHSSHPKASLARVRSGLAKLRVASAQSNWAAALETAQTVLPTIANEAAFDQARAELAGLLPDIANGFAEQAAGASDVTESAKAVEQYRLAMELVDNPSYLPASQRAAQNARIERSAEKIASVVREMEQQSRLRETVGKIDTLLTAGDPLQAYEERDALLKLYPRLHDNPQLVKAVAAISARLAEQVEVRMDQITGTTEPRPSSVVAEAALAKVSGGTVDALKDRITATVIDGVLYVLAADDGRLLWRRFVGRDTFDVHLLDTSLLVMDSQHQELLRLQPSDGKLVWRLPVGGPFEISLTGGRLLLAVAAGELWDVDMANGTCARHAHFPQSIVGQPAMSESGKLYQLGTHSNLYVLDGDTWKCEGVYFLGHKAGAIRYSPVAVADVIAIAHHVGLRRSQLHVLRETDEAPFLREAQSPLSFEGHFATGLLTERLRVIAIGQNGSLTVMALDPAKGASPLEVIAKRSGTAVDVATFAVLHDDYLFVGNDRLSAYRISSARGSLAPRWVNHAGETFVGPMQVIGTHLISARRRPGKEGVVISATPRDAADAQDAGRPTWETVIVPGASQSGLRWSPGNEQVVAACATGDAYEIPVSLAGSQSFSKPTTIGEDAPQTSSAGGVAHLDLENAISWRGGQLTPTSLGQVVYSSNDLSNGTIHPFQPQLVIGETTSWTRPAVVNNDQFLIANQRGDVYLVAINSEGALHMASTAKATTPAPTAVPVLYDGQSAVIVTRDDRGDFVQRFNLPELEAMDAIALPGRLRWGPFAVGKTLLLATTPGDLQVFSRDGNLLWSHELAGELPVGNPAAAHDDVIIATTSGSVLQLAQADGVLRWEVNTQQPLASGPLVVGERIAVQAADGSILFIASP